MARDDERTRRDGTRHPEQRESYLASTREDASLVDQIAGDSPHPDARKWIREREQDRGRDRG